MSSSSPRKAPVLPSSSSTNRSPIKSPIRSPIRSPLKSPSKSSRTPRLTHHLSRLSISDSAEIFDPPVVLLEIDQAVLKAGFPGDSCPQCTINLDPRLWSNITTKSTLGYDDVDDDDETLNDSSSLQDLRPRLINILRDVLIRRLLVAPRQLSVFILEGSLMPTPIKQTIGQVLLMDFHVKSITFQSSSINSIIGAGARHGLVVDLGWDEASVTPIYDLRELALYVGTSVKSTKLLYSRLVKATASVATTDTMETEDVTTSTATLPAWSDFDLADSGTRSLASETIHKSAREVFLENEDKYNDDNEYSLPRLIDRVLGRLDADLRGPISENIVFTNGISHPIITGQIYDDIVERVRSVWPRARRIHTIGSWQGASVYLSSLVMNRQSSGSF